MVLFLISAIPTGEASRIARNIFSLSLKASSAFLLSEVSVKERQIGLHPFLELEDQVLISDGAGVLLVVHHADRPEDLAVGPKERKPDIEDHAECQLRAPLPLGLCQCVSDQKRPAQRHDFLAIEP